MQEYLQQIIYTKWLNIKIISWLAKPSYLLKTILYFYSLDPTIIYLN